jgi:hypothetical protein
MPGHIHRKGKIGNLFVILVLSFMMILLIQGLFQDPVLYPMKLLLKPQLLGLGRHYALGLGVIRLMELILLIVYDYS